MLNELQPDLRELIELVRQSENYDATIAASMMAGTPITVGAGAVAERQRKSRRIAQLREKWNI